VNDRASTLVLFYSKNARVDERPQARLAAAHRLARDFLVMLQRYPWEKARDVASPDLITIQTRANTKTIITMLTGAGHLSHPIHES
jgi:hypothetical protein